MRSPIPPSVQWIGLGESAKLLGVSFTSVRRLIRDGHLSVREIPGSFPKVPLDEVMALCAASTRRATASAKS